LALCRWGRVARRPPALPTPRAKPAGAPVGVEAAPPAAEEIFWTVEPTEGDVVVLDGAWAVGAVTVGVVTGGTMTDGVVATGVVTDGTVTAGVVTDGTLTVGVVTAGAVATGVVTDGTVTA